MVTKAHYELFSFMQPMPMQYEQQVGTAMEVLFLQNPGVLILGPFSFQDTCDIIVLYSIDIPPMNIQPESLK